MDEARRSLRFILPGVTAGLIALLLDLICGTLTLERLAKIKDESALVVIVGALLASGAFGYLGAQIYFFLHWLPMPVFGPVDHIRIAEVIRERSPHWPEVTRQKLAQYPHPHRGAWITVTTWWFIMRGVDSRIESATERSTSLMDHAHSAGVLCCTLSMATLLWIGYAVNADVAWQRIVYGGVAAGAIGAMLYCNCANTRGLFETVVESTVRIVIADPQPALDEQVKKSADHRRQ